MLEFISFHICVYAGFLLLAFENRHRWEGASSAAVQWLVGYPATSFVVPGLGGGFFAIHVLGKKKTFFGGNYFV